MKKFSISLLMLFFTVSSLLNAQEFDTETLQQSGPDEQRINLVFLPDGYQAAELPKFKTDVQAIMEQLFDASPFKEYQHYFNVHIVYVPSNASGAARDPENLIDNYFGSTYFFAGIERLLVPTLNNVVASVLASNFPDYDQAFVLVNDDKYGGSGGWLATSSTNEQAGEIAIHEIGHSFANLSDEYWAGPQFARESPNMTSETDINLVKWSNWIGFNEVRIYPHTDNPFWRKPHTNCKMEFLGRPFCPVCQETFIESFYEIVSAVESTGPAEGDEISAEQEFFAVTKEPTPYSLKTFWMLGTDTLARDDRAFTLDLANLSDGAHSLALHVADFTVLSRKDRLPMDIVNWDINKNGNTLSINTSTIRRTADRLDIIGQPTDITSIEDDFTQQIQFNAYPNPMADQLNVSFFNPKPAPFSMQLVSMDGRVHNISSLKELDYGQQEFTIDTADMTSGVFILKLQIGSKLVMKKVMK